MKVKGNQNEDDLATILLKSFLIALLVCLSSAAGLLSLAKKLTTADKE